MQCHQIVISETTPVDLDRADKVLFVCVLE